MLYTKEELAIAVGCPLTWLERFKWMYNHLKKDAKIVNSRGYNVTVKKYEVSEKLLAEIIKATKKAKVQSRASSIPKLEKHKSKYNFNKLR